MANKTEKPAEKQKQTISPEEKKTIVTKKTVEYRCDVTLPVGSVWILVLCHECGFSHL